MKCEGCGRHGKRVKLTKFTLGFESRELCSVCLAETARGLRAHLVYQYDRPDTPVERRRELLGAIANRPGR